MAVDQENPRRTRWPWLVGGLHDGDSIPTEFQGYHDALKMLKDVPRVSDEELLSETGMVAEEVYTPRRVGSSSSPLRVVFFAVSEMPESEAQAIIWERILERAFEKNLDEQLSAAYRDEMPGELRKVGSAILRGEYMRQGEHMPDAALAGLLRKAAQVLQLIPACPECKAPLIHRRPDQRFMEDDNYVACWNGHIYGLVGQQ